MKAAMDLRKYMFYALLVGLFLTWITVPVRSAIYVRVATIGNQPHAVDKTQGMQFMVNQVIQFWRSELEQVLPDKPDLIVLPESCESPSGLSTEEQFAFIRILKNQLIDFFASVAREHHCYIVFGAIREGENKGWRNSSILLDRKGNMAGIYHKNYPTIDEIKSGIVPGKEASVFECDFGRVACVVCFDLNFTELCAKYISQKPGIILFSSNFHGGLMESYWAYQCRSFFVGALESRYAPSEILNPQGEVIASSTNYFDFTVATINLDYCLAHLDYNWEKLQKLKEKYGNDVIITDPGKMGSVLITSRHATISAADMVKEFGIELLDHYLNRSQLFRNEQIKNSNP